MSRLGNGSPSCCAPIESSKGDAALNTNTRQVLIAELAAAHITGNLVVLIARVVAGEPAPISYILSVPVFIAALAATVLLAALLGRAGVASLRPLLILQLLMLSGCFLICVANDVWIDPNDGKALIAGMLGRVSNGCAECHRAGLDKKYAFDCRDDHEY